MDDAQRRPRRGEAQDGPEHMSAGPCDAPDMHKFPLWLVLAAAVVTSGYPAGAATFDVRPEQAVLGRLLPHQARQFELGTLPAVDGRERFRLSSAHGHIEVEGSTPSALLFGVNWYLKYVARVQISPNGDRVGRAAFPLPRAVIERSTPYAYRLALNENVDGYSAPYWSWPRWQREIDVLALSGINAVLVERGTDSVLYRTFRDLGYSDAAIRRWIAAPAHQNWELMGNLCCYGGPLSRALLQKAPHFRAENSGAPARARHHSGPAGLLRHSAR